MYHILNSRSLGSYHTPSLKTIAMGEPDFSHGFSGRKTGLSLCACGRWNVRRSVVCSIKKSSTKSCRPRSIGITGGGDLRYGGNTGSAGTSLSFGGQGEESLMPL